jgi:hypothetical protein
VRPVAQREEPVPGESPDGRIHSPPGPGTPARRTGPAWAGIVIDQESNPDPRRILGRLLRRSECFDLAIGRVRLASIDFSVQDLHRVERCRVLVGGFDNHALLGAVGAAAAVPAHARNLTCLKEIIATGRLQLRSAGLWRWDPDFCLASGAGLRHWFQAGSAALVGCMGLSGPVACTMPRLACLVAGARSTDLLRNHFDRLWTVGHDILDVVAAALDAAPPRP